MSSSRFQQRFAFWWLALAMLLAPALGRMHQGAHAPQALGVPAALQGAGEVVDVTEGLFANHTGADCQLLDHQLLGGVLLSAAHAAPPVPPMPDVLPAHTPIARLGSRRLWAPLARAPPAQA